MTQVPTIRLNNGVEIPQFGFGVFQVPPEETAQTVRAAFDAGYRHIDTAQMYGNEEGVGQALAESGLSRDEVFITTKLNNDGHSFDAAVKRLDESLAKLRTDHVDLYLIHWPRPREDRYVETWKGLEKAHQDGKARTIGVSNFQPHHLDKLLEETETVPAINQIELHPHMQQAALRSYHERHGIRTEAWSPIGQGKGLLDAPELGEIAQAHDKSAAQVVLRWHIQIGNIIFPKSVTPDRIRENKDIFDFELSHEEMQKIEGMEKAERLGPDPDTFAR